jgi:ABC-type branched-subunit amino acid transport system substrate-binding protein
MVAAAILSLGLAVPASAKTPTGTTIKVGFIDQFSGPSAIPQQHDALQAYFDDWNKRGGYKNHPMQLVYDAPGSDSAATLAAVTKQNTQDKVVALLGMGVCTFSINALKPLGIPVLAGAVNTSCYDPTFMFTPTPQATTLPMMKFAVDGGVKNFGVLFPNVPTLKEGFVDPLNAYIKDNPSLGLTITPVIYPPVATAGDIDAAITTLKAAGVKALFAAAQPTTADLMMREANLNGFGPSSGIKWIWGPNIYDPNVAQKFPNLEGTYAYSQWYAWEDATNPAVKKLTKVTQGKITIKDGFAAAGYQQGALLEALMNKLKGPVTRQSLTKLFSKQKSLAMPLAPYKVNLTDFTKNPAGGQIVQIKSGAFVKSGDYVVIPAKQFA